MIAIRPALNSFLDSLRSFDRVADPKVNPKIARFQQPVPKVSRLARQFDAFENNGLRQATSATAVPLQGATRATQLNRDGFQSATRKLVELSPKPPPTQRAAIPVFRFR